MFGSAPTVTGRLMPRRPRPVQRTVPLPPMAVSVLREWKLACPKGSLDLAFPNGKGNVEFHVNVIQRGFWPAQIVAGVVTREVGARERETGQNIRGCTPCGTSMRPGASIGRLTAAWSCRRRWFSIGWAIPRSW